MSVGQLTPQILQVPFLRVKCTLKKQACTRSLGPLLTCTMKTVCQQLHAETAAGEAAVATARQQLLDVLLLLLLLPVRQSRPCEIALSSLLNMLLDGAHHCSVDLAYRSMVLSLARPTSRTLTIQTAPVYGRQSSY